MAAYDDLWAAVQSSYGNASLISLTNPDDPGASTLGSAFALDACVDVIALWPAYAQVAFDSTNELHLAVAKQGVIALFWKRGGTASESQRIEWDDVFADGGVIEKVRQTSPRGRPEPSSTSAIQTSTDVANSYGWADPKRLPPGTLPGNPAVEE